MKLLRAIPLVIFCAGQARNGALWAGDAPASAGMKKARMYIVVGESMLPTVNKGDAIASMSVWVKQLGEIRGVYNESRIEVAVTIGQIRQKLKEHMVDLMVLDTPDYLSLAEASLVEAVAAGTSRGQLAAFPYLLLTNDASETGRLAGLRGKRIVIASRTKSNMGLVWLETLLAENRLARAGSFFGSVDIGNRPSSCVLPLFFGKVDACVVDSENWELIKEMNPQLGRLRVLAHSEALLEGLLAMPIEPRHPYQREIIDSILNLHRTVAGEQLSIVFKAGPQVRVGTGQFESVANLCNRYRRLLTLPGDGWEPVAGRLEEVKERH